MNENNRNGRWVPHRALILAFILALAPLPAFAQQTVADYLKLARQKEIDFKLTEAVDIYDAILKQYPKEFPDIYVSRAEDLRFLQYHEDAIADYMTALKLDAAAKDKVLRPADIYADIAEIKAEMGDNKGALAAYNQSVQLDPKDSFVLSDRAELKLEMGDYAGSVADYSASIANAREPSSLSYQGRAYARISRGDYAAAVGDLRKSNELNQKYSPTTDIRNEYLFLWLTQTRLGLKAEADMELAASVNAVPADKRDYEYNFARYLLGQVGEETLIADADALKAKDSDNGDLFHNHAYYYIGMKKLVTGDKAGALTWLRKSLAGEDRFVNMGALAQAEVAALTRQPAKSP